MVYSIRKCNILLDLEEITVFFGFYAVESYLLKNSFSDSGLKRTVSG
jgi:hypothetical protein